MAEELVSHSHSVYCLCVSGGCDLGAGYGRNLSCWLLEFQEGVSHFLWVNLGDVYCYCEDEQPAPTQQSAVPLRLMYHAVRYWIRLFYIDTGRHSPQIVSYCVTPGINLAAVLFDISISAQGPHSDNCAFLHLQKCCSLLNLASNLH